MRFIYQQDLPRAHVRSHKQPRYNLKQPTRRGRVNEWVRQVDDGQLPGFKPGTRLRSSALIHERLKQCHPLLEARELGRVEVLLVHFELQDELAVCVVLPQLSEDRL